MAMSLLETPPAASALAVGQAARMAVPPRKAPALPKNPARLTPARSAVSRIAPSRSSSSIAGKRSLLEFILIQSFLWSGRSARDEPGRLDRGQDVRLRLGGVERRRSGRRGVAAALDVSDPRCVACLDRKDRSSRQEYCRRLDARRSALVSRDAGVLECLSRRSELLG